MLLRKITGAHTADLSIIQFDFHLSLIATGSVNGEVAVWDYEMSRLLGMCLGHKKNNDITAIEFLSPYPLMVTASLDCKVIIWTVRPVPAINCYVCLHNFLNYDLTVGSQTD